MLALQHLLYDKRDIPIAGIGEYGNKITQNQLARFLSVDQGMITKLENGTRSSSTTMVDTCAGDILVNQWDRQFLKVRLMK